jgi:hypothetical protein
MVTTQEEELHINDRVRIKSKRSPWNTYEGIVEKMYESSGWYAINIQGKTVQFKRKGLIKVPTKSSKQSTDDEEETIGTATRNHDGHNNNGRTTPTRTNRNSNSNSTHSRNDESSATPNTGQASNNFTMEETDHLQL